MSISDSIMNGARTAYLDSSIFSLEYLRPRLILNNRGMKVLNYLKDELHHCDEFCFSVAFITMSGITPLLQDLVELEHRGVKGKILTTDYLNFTEPKALEKLLEFSNIEVRFFYQEREGFHTKGYFFRSGDVYTGIIGSSNLTLKALTVNNEWNLGFSSLYDSEVLQDVLDEFDELWNKSSNVSDILQEYKSTYNSHDRNGLLSIEKREHRTSFKPNTMQREFISNLHELLDKGEKRALLVSATGTGKTYASAFAVKDVQPRKFLFLVHREQIAKQAIESYKRVFRGEAEKFGLLTGNSHDYNKDYLFATVQTMRKKDVYTLYAPDEFDYIVIDEVHKAGAESYRKLFEYFTPKFYLGMSASPDRTDDFSIYELFDYNVPLDIRLEDALEEDLLCPFQYFGITDLEVNGKVLDDESEFIYLTSDARVNYILEKSEFYGYSGNRRKALVFCSTKKEAHELAEKFNMKGHPTVALTGEDKQEAREDAIDRLTNDKREDKLEYIITVDIFNEGVDIPEVNQVLLVRPTQSSIIFIQQLGRDLHKTKDKEYVVVLDFIGNYKNNFLIPIALSGDVSYDKDTARYLMEANKQIIGSSTINFDEISRKRIYESINNASFSNIKLFREKYQKLRNRLNRTPYLVDFYEHGELDPLAILQHNKFDCYHNFLAAYDKEYNEVMTKEEVKSLKFITDYFADGKRPHELTILELLAENRYFTVRQVEEKLERYGITGDIESIRHCYRMFDQSFLKKNDRKKYQGVTYFECTDNIDEIKEHDTAHYKITEEFKDYLESDTYRKHFNDLVDYALLRYTDKYCPQTEHVNLKLYGKYSRKDVCRLLNWPGNDSATMYGYRIKYDTLPMFVNYKKKKDITNSTKYRDRFESRDIFSWMTRNNVKLTSKEPMEIMEKKKNS